MIGECLPRLTAIGISYSDASELRRISMTLHRWHEMECGDSNDHGSWTIARGRKKGGEFEHDDEGKPFLEYHSHTANKATYTPIADRENGARKRLAAIMAKYPGMTAYVQGDPRGAALYILRPGDVPEGQDAGAFYTRGICVYK